VRTVVTGQRSSGLLIGHQAGEFEMAIHSRSMASRLAMHPLANTTENAAAISRFKCMSAKYRSSGHSSPDIVSSDATPEHPSGERSRKCEKADEQPAIRRGRSDIP
jgi:hypothetical protein